MNKNGVFIDIKYQCVVCGSQYKTGDRMTHDAIHYDEGVGKLTFISDVSTDLMGMGICKKCLAKVEEVKAILLLGALIKPEEVRDITLTSARLTGLGVAIPKWLFRDMFPALNKDARYAIVEQSFLVKIKDVIDLRSKL